MHRARDQRSRRLLLKVVLPDAERESLRREHRLLTRVQSDRCARSLGLTAWDGRLALALEDRGDRSGLDLVREGLPALAQALRVGADVATALAAVHRAGLAHCDVTPGNVVIDQAGRACLVDFGLAVPVPEGRDSLEVAGRAVIRGTLAYLSPEQTRRTLDPIDGRSDLYGLGATLYHLLTGRPPFDDDEALSLLAAHLTRVPEDVRRFRPEVPAEVAAVVARLLAKAPGDRYQRAETVAADLERCERALAAGRSIPDFRPGAEDLGLRPDDPRRLHGRDDERATLAGLVERVSEGGHAAAMVAGFSGVGKSRLVEAVVPNLTARGFRLGRGKFDQLREGSALDAIGGAIEPVLAGALAQSPALLDRFSDDPDVLDRLAPLLPSVARQAAAYGGPARLTGGAQAQLQEAVARLLRALIEVGGPVCLFIDDLQWADRSAVALLGALIGREELAGLLVIGAYRDHEVGEGHPLAAALAQWSKLDEAPIRLTLAPLTVDHTAALIADMLRVEPAEVAGLAGEVHRRTDGNPLFTAHFIFSLFDAGGLRVEEGERRWRWDEAAVKAVPPDAGIVDLLVARMSELPPGAQRPLVALAAAGQRAEICLLSNALRVPPATVLRSIRPAVEQGLVVVEGTFLAWPKPPRRLRARARPRRPQTARTRGRRSDAHGHLVLRFAHDRIQQAAYALLAEPDRAPLHASLGLALLASAEPERMVRGVDQCLFGEAALVEPRHAAWVAGRARLAATLASRGVAHRQAARAGGLAARLLDRAQGGAWAPERIELEIERAVNHSLAAEFDLADVAFEQVLERAQGKLRTQAHRALSDHYLLQGRFDAALTAQLAGLRALGVTLPDDHSPDAGTSPHLRAAFDELRALVGDDVEALLKLRTSADPDQAARLHLLYGMFLAAYLSGRSIQAFLAVTQMARLSVTGGLAPLSSYGFGAYGMVLTLVRGDFSRGRRFGDLGVRVAQRLDDASVRARAMFLFAADVHNWTGPIGESLPWYDRARGLATRVGDWLTVGYVIMQSGSDRLTSGEPLAPLYEELERDLGFLRRTGNQEAEAALQAGVLGPIRQLRGRATGADPLGFDGPGFDEAAYVARYEGNPFYQAWLVYAKLRAVYLFGDLADYQAWVGRVAVVESSVPSHTKVPVAVMYAALMRCRLAREAGAAAAQAHVAELSRLRGRLAEWAAAGPANVAHRRALVEGEVAWLEGRPGEAMRWYERAVAQARAARCVPVEALATERAAVLAGAEGRAQEQALRKAEAQRLWRDWGADACAARLSGEAAAPKEPAQGAVLQTGMWLDPLDVAALLRLLRAMDTHSGEADLVREVLRLVIREVGATAAVLSLTTGHGGDGGRVVYLTADGREPVWGQSLAEAERQTGVPAALSQACRDQGRVVRWTAPAGGAAVAVPLLTRGQGLGSLALVNRLVRAAFTPRHVELLRLVARQVAFALMAQRQLAAQREARSALEALVDQRTEALQASLESLQSAQQALEDARDEAEINRKRAERANAAKSGFLSMVAHELRGPLNSVMGFIQLMQRQRPPPDMADSLAVVHRNARHLLDLVEELLDLARIEAGLVDVAPRPTDWRALLRECAQSQAPLISESERTLDVALADGPAALELDPKRVRQVVSNLLTNAMRHADGTVRLEAVVLPAGDGRVQLQVSVEDEGPGLTPEEQVRLFEPFARGREAGPGAGLGLAISQKLCVRHGGALTVRSDPGRGCRFTATFQGRPAAEVQVVEPLSAELGRVTGYGGSRRAVSVVEDDPDSRRLLVALLAPLGFDVVGYGSAEDALADPRQESADLVISDLQLPGMDGLELLETLRARGFGGPVCLLSAHISRLGRARLDHLGAVETLTKPVNLKQLLDKVERLLGLTWEYLPRTPSPGIAEAAVSANELERLADLVRSGRTGDLLAAVRARRAEVGQGDRFSAELRRAVLTFRREAMLEVLGRWRLREGAP